MSQVQSIKYREKGTHLTFTERQTLEKILSDNQKLKKKDRTSKIHIAEMMGIDRSTLYRELKRGQVDQVTSMWETYVSYSADLAQDNYDRQATSKGKDLKIGKDHNLANYIEERILKDRYSPDAIVMTLEKSNHDFSITLSTRTIYNYIENGVFLHVTNKDLPREGKIKKRGYHRIRKRVLDPEAKSIVERPKEIESRETPGHWEMDCIESGKKSSGSTLLTMVERTTRKTIMRKMTSHSQEQVLKAIHSIEKNIGQEAFQRRFQTITVDNGSEFLDWKALESSCIEKNTKRTAIYYCHPYSSYERGSNENANGHIRRYIPKGSDIGDYTEEDIKTIEGWLNSYPRRILEGAAANEAFESFLSQAAA